MNLTAKLNNWEMVPTYLDSKFIIWGDIEGDAKGRFLDGTRIHTSWLKDPRKDFKEGDIVRTEYSSYLLGTPKEETSDNH